MNIANQVESILEHVPYTRNSDKELLLVYLQKSGMDLDERQIDIFRTMPSMETIRRVRQRIQEEGRYKASPNVAKARRLKSYVIQQASPHTSPERVEQLINQDIISTANRLFE
jgi:hypothetical protein